MYKWSFPKSFKETHKKMLDILEARKWMTTTKLELWWWHTNPTVKNFTEYLKLVEYGNLDG